MKCKLSDKIFYKGVKMKIVNEEQRVISDIVRFYAALEAPIKIKLLTAHIITEAEKVLEEENNG
jgi:hypothetical protein